jgi:hypothetical protein
MKSIIALVLLLAVTLVLGAGMPASADCQDTKVECWAPKGDGTHDEFAGGVKVGACWQWKAFGCMPCAMEQSCDYKANCNSKYPSKCNGNCWIYWRNPGSGASIACPATFKPPYDPFPTPSF